MIRHTEITDDMIRNLADKLIDGLMMDGAHHKQWVLEETLRLLATDEFMEVKDMWQWEDGLPP